MTSDFLCSAFCKVHLAVFIKKKKKEGGGGDFKVRLKNLNLFFPKKRKRGVLQLSAQQHTGP